MHVLAVELKIKNNWNQSIPNMVLTIHSWQDGARYEGHWDRDKKHGEGHEIWMVVHIQERM